MKGSCMCFRRLLIGLLSVALLPWASLTPKTYAITNFDVIVTPNIPSAQAEYVFSFSIEKVVQVFDRICLQFPEDIVFPESEKDLSDPFLPAWPEIKINHEKKTISFLSHIELNPSIEGYRDIRIRIPRSLGIKNPSTSGAYYFGISTTAEPKMKKSNAVIISRKPASILHCTMLAGSSVVSVNEIKKSYNKKYLINHASEIFNINPLAGLFIPVEHFGSYFGMSFYKDFSSKANKTTYTWINRSNRRLVFQKNSEGFSNPHVDGVEKQWINVPFILNNQKNDLLIDLHSMMRLFDYPLIYIEDTDYYMYRDPFGSEYLFNRKNFTMEAKQVEQVYLYDYHLLSPIEKINNDLHIDLNFFMFHLWSTLEVKETKNQNEIEIAYFGKDENNNLWNVNFIYLSTGDHFELKHIEIVFNDQIITVSHQILPSQEIISPKIDHSQVLVSLDPIISLMGANLTWQKTYSEASVTFNSHNYSPLIPEETAKATGEWELEIIMNSSDNDPDNTLSINELLAKDDVNGVVLHFWTSWQEKGWYENLLAMQRVFKDYEKVGLKVLLIYVDYKHEGDINMMKEAISDLNVTCPVLLDYDANIKKLNYVDRIPANLLIDKQGKIRYEEQAQKSPLNLLHTTPIDVSMLRNAIDYLLE